MIFFLQLFAFLTDHNDKFQSGFEAILNDELLLIVLELTAALT